MPDSLEEAEDLRTLTTEIVSAYVSHNSISLADLPGLISKVYGALRELVAPSAVPESAPAQTAVPAVSIRKSITPDYLICLDDGRRLKSLKRHLAQLGMTPEQYRAKWKLPPDYPMVAPNYSATRAALAKANGLGRTAAAAPASGKRKIAAA